MAQQLIGLSLSFCAPSICRGEVSLENVQKIVAATKFSTEVDWQAGISSYQESYWYDFPEEAEQVVKSLYAQGKIIQPRLQNNDHFPSIGNRVIWVSSKEEIRWNDAQS